MAEGVFEPPDGPWEIIRFSASTDEDDFIDIEDRPSFVQFLRQFKPDRTVMKHLRGMLVQWYAVSLLTDDQVIELIAWQVWARHLAIRLHKGRYDFEDRPGGGGGGGGGRRSEPSQPDGPGRPPGGSPWDDGPKRRIRSWFGVTVVYEDNGQEKPVPNLTLYVELPGLGEVTGVTSRRIGHVRWDDLDPGGTGDILATTHDEIVWEVTADID